MKKLDALKIKLKTGKEPFLVNNQNLNFNLKDFWSWSQSDLLNNTMRGVLAEYIVKQDLGIKKSSRSDWDPYDLETDGGIKIEVKSGAYLQSWKQHELSKITFNIAPTKERNENTNKYSKEPKRNSDFYVFCLLHKKDKETVDPLNLDQWTFYVLLTKVLDNLRKEQKSISLSSLLNLNPTKCKFGEIRKVISKENG